MVCLPQQSPVLLLIYLRQDNDPCESPSHYFMHCPLYNIHRQELVDSFNELNIEFTIQTILYGSETSDYNQNVKLLRAVHSFIKRSKRFDNNIVI